jgi:8-oxo-dGTP pyrophosphatase MutT (NUDIX family)
MTAAEDPLVVDARRVLIEWQAPSAAQDDLRARYLAFLDEHPDAASRDLRTGHLTASTLVLDAARERALLTLHPMAGRWFQLGGHVEAGDATMAAAALREATEESGIHGLDLHPAPIGLDWHEVRCRNRYGVPAPSSHLDVEYLALAPSGAEHQRSDESLDLAWFALDALPEGADDVVRALIQRVRDLGLA